MKILGFKSQLQQIASDAGFSAVGITDPLKVDQTIKEKFRDFIKNDWNAGMDWLEKRINERIAPENLWPSVKSILVFTDDYTPADNPLKKLMDKELANISVYATKRDYHKVVKSKLKLVASWVKKKLDCELKIFVDTAPVMEKPLAQLSGLGWQGKHTNLVSRNMGNWFFIGVMYIDKSLPADEPEQDNCGSCTKCLDICPTNAFAGAYKLDARKCIAYLTIEHKGAIDKELRSSIGNRVFGCDDCLAVCPWNKFAQISRNENYREIVEASMEKAGVYINKYPHAHSTAIFVNRYLSEGPHEIALSTVDGDNSLLNVIREKYLPCKILAEASSKLDIPLLKDKEPIGGKSTAYICKNYACQEPIVDDKVLKNQLR